MPPQTPTAGPGQFTAGVSLTPHTGPPEPRARTQGSARSEIAAPVLTAAGGDVSAAPPGSLSLSEDSPRWVSDPNSDLGPDPAHARARSGGHKGSGVTPAVVLDNYATSRPRGWDKRQRRIFQRVMTHLIYWESHHYQVAWLNLTTAPGGDARKLGRHFDSLLRRVERKFGYHAMEYYVVRTSEGNGVLHCLIAWRPGPEEKHREFWLPHSWLKSAWLAIHGAEVLVIRRYRAGRDSSMKLSRYLVAQYVGGQVGIVRCFWSWRRTFGLPIVQVWTHFKAIFRHRGMVGVIARWNQFLRGENIRCPDRGPLAGKWVCSLEAQRARKSVWPVEVQGELP